ncbi:hypothetical protein F3J11_07810 [Burkholderia sp. Cy-647]|uniref:hypothetical protein n=1 Tax=Burkholderia sp. Cy-647 TaxID=2608328 RepID=UPI0014220EC6|nr:hypothetical protein [Burkholderia sp. Cy-647]NIF62608.1 hypothetical protein [Burkholderia sp. Cy-647]
MAKQDTPNPYRDSAPTRHVERFVRISAHYLGAPGLTPAAHAPLSTSPGSRRACAPGQPKQEARR